MGKFRVKTTTVSHIDRSTGEVDERIEKVEIESAKKEPFFLTYSKQICSFYSMGIFNSTTKVLWKMLEYAEWNTGKVYLTTDRREEVMEVCGISKTSFYRSVDELIHAGIIAKGKGSYTINEAYLWKGSEMARRSLIDARASIIISPVYDG